MRLDREHSIEIAFLALATIYSLTLPLKHTITLWDAAILVTIFVLYTSGSPALLPRNRTSSDRHATWARSARGPADARVIAIAVFAAVVILLVAERFAEALVASGEALGVSEFLLVQWIAPLASEAPELLVAGLYAWRLNTSTGLGTLVSSKVNQWTLLVGTLPIVFAIAAGGLHGLPLDTVQREELFLTAAQSFFAVAVLSSLTLSLREAGFLFSLFWFQFILGRDRPRVPPRRRTHRRRHPVPDPRACGCCCAIEAVSAACSATGSERPTTNSRPSEPPISLRAAPWRLRADWSSAPGR